MTRVEFTSMVWQLLRFARNNGIDVALDYCKRSAEEQERLVKAGKSKTLKSKHVIGRAVDLIIFKDGEPLWDSPYYSILGQWWEQQGGTWGGRWESLNDVYHFECDE